MLAAPLLTVLAVLAGPVRAPAADPCRAAAAPLARPADLPREVARAIEAYRAAWRRACAPKGTVDLAALLGDAEVLAEDARTSRYVREIAAGALQRGEAWPLPGIRPVDGDLAVDWAAFAPLGARGSVDDVRFWRGAAVAADAVGGPAWLGDVPPGGAAECIRLGESPWTEVARALDDMEAAEAPQYSGHARELRDRLSETLARVARGPTVCGCVRGDPIAGLPALAAASPDERRKTQAQRAVVAGAGAALDALRTGRVKVQWLRDRPGGDPTGCRAP
jgi:antitoxin (DNA-binding transcriptional repressor) of toxin-antitoxin stability system